MNYANLREAVVLAGVLLLLPTVVGAKGEPLKLDMTHSRIGFTASTLLFDVEGKFNDVAIVVEGDPAKPTKAKIIAEIPVASIDTDNEKRDDHLRNEDFFDAAKFPTIRFVSKRIKKTAEGLKIDGTLTMRGKSQPVSFPLRVATGKNAAGVESTAYRGSLTINRTDFGVGNESLAAKISLRNTVQIHLMVVAFL